MPVIDWSWRPVLRLSFHPRGCRAAAGGSRSSDCRFLSQKEIIAKDRLDALGSIFGRMHPGAAITDRKHDDEPHGAPGERATASRCCERAAGGWTVCQCRRGGKYCWHDDVGQRDDFYEVIRNATPPQQLAFLVGRPEYLADAPKANGQSCIHENIEQVQAVDVSAPFVAESSDPPQRWGILEASRRISAVRSACVARTQAMRNLPAPPRDSEGRISKRTAMPPTLDDLLREEMQ